ncbi:cilia- and flagella-associated protein 77-like [Biomphalaria glabrata]|uniref:Cilia- and flagella-associated protein 77-like n=1 Tax=Biomphalaria glabrata TaxID=6526 RepID=A0A9W3BH20_BIOGL|nr:cilia- and flagella-associated protein 77-like [Biomphalaria glabrata]
MPSPWDTECDPFNYTSTGYLGKKRPEMLINELLLKDKMGKPKARGRVLPKNITFGDVNNCPWTAAHALSGWAGHLPTQKEITGEEPVVRCDFLQLNRGAITSGIVNPKELRVFRKTHFRMYAPGMIDGERSEKKIERPPAKKHDPNKVFGMVNPQDPPLQDFLTHKFQNDWLKGTKVQSNTVAANEKFNMKWSRWAPTRASLLREVLVPVAIDEQPWRMPKFVDKVKPHLSTFRSEKELEDAWEAYNYEKCGRLGQTGQGITISNVRERPYLPAIKST